VKSKVLEKRIVPETAGIGHGFYDLTAAGGGVLRTGQFVMLNSVFAATVSRTGDYAEAGDTRWTIASSGTAGINSGWNIIGVADKLAYKKEDSDLTLDIIESGAGIIVYTQGFFETDQYNTDMNTDPAVGDPLYIDTVGKLCKTAGGLNAKPVAIFWGKRSTFDSNYQATGYVYFQLLPRNRET
jgi:hypothetical protein